MEAILEALTNFFTDPAWLIPAAVAVAAQLVLTNLAKPFLPTRWTDPKRDAVISLLSIAIGITVFVAIRWAWLDIAGETVTAAHFVLSAGVALIVIAAMPAIYARLPETVRRKHSYEAKITKKHEATHKTVRMPSGSIVLRPIEEPSGEGEKTVGVWAPGGEQ